MKEFLLVFLITFYLTAKDPKNECYQFVSGILLFIFLCENLTMYRDPEFWKNFLSDFKILIGVFILFCSLTGAINQFVKNNLPYRVDVFFVEFGGSIIAGWVTYFFLKVSGTPEEIICGAAGLASYFGTKSLTYFYRHFLKHLTEFLQNLNKSDKESKND